MPKQNDPEQHIQGSQQGTPKPGLDPKSSPQPQHDADDGDIATPKSSPSTDDDQPLD